MCVLFVFGALAEYAGVLLKIKIAATRSSSYYPGKRGLESPVANSIVLANGNTILHDEYALKFEVNVAIQFRMILNCIKDGIFYISNGFLHFCTG